MHLGFLRRRFCRGRLSGRSFSFPRRRLKHPAILRKIDNRAQRNFAGILVWVAHASSRVGFGVAPKRSFFTGKFAIAGRNRQHARTRALPGGDATAPRERNAVASRLRRDRCHFRSRPARLQLLGAESTSSRRVCSRRALPWSRRKAHRLLRWCVCCA